ncbi:hypothetical protein VPR01S_05_01100 [Vibrio proteolyticus NBRC 13287]|uniref:Uncharacterized protein n=1 Tax=Vibrio proteolyticus NBRC 13287 TaxID=1219065 RepID=U2ZZI3_VIBPR|nr:hypothetical protein VPR01S_05_01100 [Vibrio proteolyticus NBRC 13287]
MDTSRISISLEVHYRIDYYRYLHEIVAEKLRPISVSDEALSKAIYIFEGDSVTTIALS